MPRPHEGAPVQDRKRTFGGHDIAWPLGGVAEPLGLALGLPLLVPQESTDPTPTHAWALWGGQLHGPEAVPLGLPPLPASYA